MLTRREALIGAAALAAAPGATAPPQPNDAFQAFARQNRYLPLLMRLRGEAVASGRRQTLAQILAMVGEERAAKRAWEAEPHTRDPTPNLDAAVSQDAIEAIVQASRGRRVVILNEAHQISACRLLLRDVAQALRAEGFDVLAAETFTPGTIAPWIEAWRYGQTFDNRIGYYTSDPVFAESVRQASAMGYRLAVYEHLYEGPPSGDREVQIRERESGEAANLARFLANNPLSRVLVYCGFSHAAKVPTRGSDWMARRLGALTGIDPLSIEQSQNWPGSTPDRDEAIPQAVLRRFSFDGPIAVSVGGRPLLAPPYGEGAMDLSVFHPRLSDVDARPGWWAADRARRRTPVRLPRPTEVEVLLQAQPADEGATAIPSDHVLLGPGATEAVLYLRPGAYRIRVETPDGHESLPPLTVA